MTHKLAATLITMLALTGCSATADPAPGAEETAPAQNMCQGLDIESCTGMLTDYVSLAYDKYGDMQTPTDDQTRAYDALNDMSGEWSMTCSKDPAAVNDWSMTAGGECSELARSITEQVLVIDPDLAP